MSVFSEALLCALWRASCQGSLVILLFWCLCRGLEKHLSADVRCWLWRAVSIKMLLGLLVLSPIVVPILPAASPFGTRSLEFLELSPAFVSTSAEFGEASKTKEPPKTLPVTPNTIANAPLHSLSFFSGQTLLAVLYAIGVVTCLVRVIRACFRTRRFVQAAARNSSPQETESEMTALAARLGLSPVPRLLRSSAIDLPVYALGAVLLPTNADYAPEELRLILAHELAHARRRDLVWEWLGTLTQAVFFFHPLLILARREERLARESAADVLALRTTGAPCAAYGKLLLSLSLTRQTGRLLTGTVGVIDGTPLRRRLLSLQEVRVMSSPTRSRKNAALQLASGLVAVLALIPWRVTQAVAAPQEPFHPRLPEPITGPSVLRDPATGQLYLRNVSALPLLAFTRSLGLTPDQQTQIKRIQQRTYDQLVKDFLQQAEQRRQLIATYLPSVRLTSYGAANQAEWITASEALERAKKGDWKQYATAMHQTIEQGKQQAQRLDSAASQDVLEVLSEKQAQRLPVLLREGSILQAVGLPIALYEDFALDSHQKDTMRALVQTSVARRKQLFAASVAALKKEIAVPVQPGSGSTPGTTAEMKSPAVRQQIRRDLTALRQQQQQTHAAALAVLTQKQRNLLRSYLQTHPHPTNQ